jgi:polar amino acid transport system substrate-binding protein
MTSRPSSSPEDGRAGRLRRGAWRALRPLATLAILVACAAGTDSGREDPGAGTLERLRAAGTARVGYANEAPYAYLEGGRLTGEAPSVARAILARLGIPEVDGVLTEFGSLIPGLKAGRFDLVAAGMYITPERCREAAFTRPTYGIGEAFVVAAGNPLGLHSYADVAASDGARLGVVAGAVQRGYARRTGVPDGRVVVFPEAPSAVEGVASGRVDAYAGTSLTVDDLLTKHAGDRLERARPFTDPVIDGRPVRGYGAFAVRRGDVDLLTALDRELETFLGTSEHLDLVVPFGFGEETLPGDVTAAELCRAETGS